MICPSQDLQYSILESQYKFKAATQQKYAILYQPHIFKVISRSLQIAKSCSSN